MFYAVILGVIAFLGAMPRKYYCFTIATILALVIGLRGLNIGIDTYSYFNMFNTIIDNNLQYSFESMNIEKGYVFLNYILGRFMGGNFHILLLVIAVLYIVSVSFVIYKYSENPWLSFLLFVAFGYFTFGMSGLRQTMAMSFTMISFLFIKKNKLGFYLFFIAIAYSLHVSALVFLPAYFMDKIKISKYSLSIAAIIIIPIAFFVEFLFNYLNAFARISYQEMETGGMLMYLFFVATTLLGLFLRKESDNNDFYYFMMLATIVLWPIAKTHPAMFRLTFYYSIFMIIFIPNILKSVKDWRLRLIYTGSYVIVAIFNITNKVLIPGIQLLPYRFFWENY